MVTDLQHRKSTTRVVRTDDVALYATRELQIKLKYT